MQYYDPNMYEERQAVYLKKLARDQKEHPKEPAILFHRDILTRRQDPDAIHDRGLDIPFTVTNICAQIDLPYIIPLEQLRMIGSYRPDTLKMVKIRIFLNENDACIVCVNESGTCHILGATTYEQIRFVISELMKKLAPFIKKTTSESE